MSDRRPARKKGPRFGAVPERAATGSDPRLTGIHYMALAFIALCDGMSLVAQRGQGCFVKVEDIARRFRVHRSSMSVAIGQLVSWGYLCAEPNPRDRKCKIYRVVYGNALPTDNEEGDAVALSPGNQGSRNGQPNRSDLGNTIGAMRCPENGNLQQVQVDRSPLDHTKDYRSKRESARAPSRIRRKRSAYHSLQKHQDRSWAHYLEIAEKIVEAGDTVTEFDVECLEGMNIGVESNDPLRQRIRLLLAKVKGNDRL